MTSKNIIDILSKSQEEINKATNDILDKVDARTKSYHNLIAELEKETMFLNSVLDGEVSDFTETIQDKLKDIIKNSQDANLKNLKNQSQRLKQIQEIVNAQSPNLSKEEREMLSQNLARVSGQVQQDISKKSSIVGRLGEFGKSQGINVGSVMAGAMSGNPILTFLGKAVGDMIESQMERKKEDRDRLLEENLELQKTIWKQNEKLFDKQSKAFDSQKEETQHQSEILEEVLEQQTELNETNQNLEKIQENMLELEKQRERANVQEERRRRIKTPSLGGKDQDSIGFNLKSLFPLLFKSVRGFLNKALIIPLTGFITWMSAKSGFIATLVAGVTAITTRLFLVMKKTISVLWQVLSKSLTTLFSGLRTAITRMGIVVAAAVSKGGGFFGGMGSKMGRAGGVLSRAGGMVGRVAAPIAVIGAGSELADNMMTHGAGEGSGRFLSGIDSETGKRRSILGNMLAHGMTGAAAGGIAGSFVPVLGNMAGAIGGGLLGAGTGLTSSVVSRWRNNETDSSRLSDATTELVDHNGKEIGTQLIDLNETSTELLEQLLELEEEHLKETQKLTKDDSNVNNASFLKAFETMLRKDQHSVRSRLSDIRDNRKISANNRQVIQEVLDATMSPSQRNKIGSVSQRFESGSRGTATISSGKGDFGGKSYGKYQFSSKVGTLQHFLNDSGYSHMFHGLEPGSKEFDNKWLELAKNPQFQKAEHDYIMKSHFGPLNNRLMESGIDLSNRSQAVQEMIFSVGTQYGTKLGSQLFREALDKQNIDNLSDEEIINLVQKHRKNTVNRYFASSSADVRSSVANRSDQEQRALLEVLNQDKQRSNQLNAQSEKLMNNLSNPKIFVNNQVANNPNNSVIPDSSSSGLPSKIGSTRNPESILHALIKTQYWFSQY